MRSKATLLVLAGLAIVVTMSLFSSLFSSGNAASMVEPYDAPQAETQDQNGNPVKLGEIYVKGLTLVYFYPKADTPGCTAQACSLRDAYTDLTKAGIHVIGVSTDDVAAQKKFEKKYNLPFTLLADPDGKLAKAFGVKTIPLLGFATRQAFLVKEGKVIWHDAKASTVEQAADVLKVVNGTP